MNDFEKLITCPLPTPARPLLGLTILVVEDSRYASEAMRLLCLRSGARIRRADCLRSARKHLQVYSPNVVIVDMGLPDGSGKELLAELSSVTDPKPILLATSGDKEAAQDAQKAGAVGFLPKPVSNLAFFQSFILAHLPSDHLPRGPRPVSAEEIMPDELALHDDFAQIENTLSHSADKDTLEYLANFLAGLAQSAQDPSLAKAAEALTRNDGQPRNNDIIQISTLLRKRRQAQRAI
ncbi:response regulator [Falsihalocynthiibacter sp. SS001]|uniref:response regulator n=1 Tax=Falsihalocynthiibacter sp. SS001 TaxID=3349698 RepID=UPI0036D36F86